MNNRFTWSSELYHSGVKGMKWYQRLYQNKDGSLTPLGRIHYGLKNVAAVRRQKSIDKLTSKASTGKMKAALRAADKMSDEELRKEVERLKLENEYYSTVKKSKEIVSGATFVKSFASTSVSVAKDILTNSIRNIGTQALTYGLGTAINKKFESKTKGDQVVNPKKGQKDK